MTALTSFAAIVSILLALAVGATTTTEADLTSRKAGKGGQAESLITPSKLATNHNETLVRDTAPMN